MLGGFSGHQINLLHSPHNKYNNNLGHLAQLRRMPANLSVASFRMSASIVYRLCNGWIPRTFGKTASYADTPKPHPQIKPAKPAKPAKSTIISIFASETPMHSESQKKYQNDDCCLDDSLGMAPAGDRTAKIVLDAAPPFTLGVIGKWGSGKTSLMRRAFAALGGKPVSQALPLGEDRKDDEDAAWKEVAHDAPKRDLPLELTQQQQALPQTLCVWYSPWRHQNADNPMIPLLLEIQKQYAWRFKALEKGKKINRRGGLAGLALLERAADAALVWRWGSR